ncbi:type II toxin-antitoxin system HicA family toxin [Propionivibrio sp.]|uniref:type II toxin-antitoxin system HicA family toxin n=1 Tax=Propionivibrio sp. TaxID=2212460 RepID=UPI003BF026F3
MSKQQKTIEKMCRTPTPSNVKWADLKSALECLGYRMLTNSGSRRKFFHKEKDALIICHEPHPSPDVDKGCIDDIVEHLRIHGFVGR